MTKKVTTLILVAGLFVVGSSSFAFDCVSSRDVIIHRVGQVNIGKTSKDVNVTVQIVDPAKNSQCTSFKERDLLDFSSTTPAPSGKCYPRVEWVEDLPLCDGANKESVAQPLIADLTQKCNADPEGYRTTSAQLCGGSSPCLNRLDFSYVDFHVNPFGLRRGTEQERSWGNGAAKPAK